MSGSPGPESVLRPMVGELTRFPDQSVILQIVARQFLVQRLQTHQVCSVAKSVRNATRLESLKNHMTTLNIGKYGEIGHRKKNSENFKSCKFERKMFYK